MKSKKIIAAFSIAALCIIGGGKIVSANSINYSFRLPATGYRTTGDVRKTDSSTTAINKVSYVGKPQYRIDFWGTTSAGRETTQSYFYGTGTKYAYYATGPQADELNGKNVYMTIKTGPATFTEIDVNGTWTP